MFLFNALVKFLKIDKENFIDMCYIIFLYLLLFSVVFQALYFVWPLVKDFLFK